jgi:tetratricopeptide (TPR) repeat protein
LSDRLSSRNRRTGWAIAIGLCLITAAVYAPVCHFAFVNYDDYDYVTQNPIVVGGFSVQHAVSAFTKFYSHNWHPVTWLSHMLDVQLWGLDAGAHHIVNVAFHIANAVLLFLLLISVTGALWRSAFVAAVFAWHPLHVESVAWIAERKDVLSTFFWVLTMSAYVHYARHPRARRFLLVVICFSFGLMSKPMVVTLPFILLLIDYWPLNRARLSRDDRRQWFKLLLEKVPLFILALIACVITLEVQSRSGAVRSLLQVPLQFRVSNALIACVSYLWKTVWPVGLAVFYPLPRVISFWQAMLAAALLLGLTWFVFSLAKRYHYLVVGWLWFLVTLVPVIGIVQVGDQSRADRYTYIPLIGTTIAAAWGTWDLSKKTKRAQIILAAFSAVFLLLLLQATARQLQHWRNNVSLYQRALAVTSDNWLAHNNLSNALLEQHRDAVAAENHARQALRIRPSYAEAHVNLGVALSRQGKFAEAISNLENALLLAPQSADAEQYLGYAFMNAGKMREAVRHFSKVLGRKPNLILALKSLAWIRATDPSSEIRNANEAVMLGQRAAKLTAYQSADALRVLAAALAEAGRFDEAVTTGERGRNLARAASQPELVRQITEQLDLYRLGLPYRNKVSFLPNERLFAP